METEPSTPTSNLLERLDYLEKANQQSLFAMELATSMVHFHGKLSHTRDPGVILIESQKFLRQLMLDFETMAFFLVEEEDASFDLVQCDPKEKTDAILELEDRLIDEGEFAWALNQNRGVVSRLKEGTHSVILHAISTDRRIRGLFVGVIDLGGEELPNSFYNLFSIIFRNTAYALESAEMYRLLDDYNKHLEQRVEQRTAELHIANTELERANKFIRNTFGRFMSDEVVERILDTPEGLRLGGEKKHISVMMTDIRGFTAISEKQTPEKVVTILNMYLEVMTEIILKYNGTINEFLGDGLLILFGAPITREDDAKRAIACALEMQLAMPRVNANNRKHGYPELKMGVGINTGPVVAGNIGTEKRSKYSVIGTTINMASRIESYTVGGQVLIAEETLKACDALLRIDDQWSVLPKGISHPITIYQVGGIGGSYDVHLPKPREPEYQEVPAEKWPGGLAVYFSVLEGKHASAMDNTGRILRLSETGAELRTDTVIERLNNLKIILLQGDEEVTRELFCKVTGISSKTESTWRITFTSTPPEAKKLFEEVLRAAEAP